MSLTRALNIHDLRQLAKRRLPRMVFDYIDGGADDEIALATNSARFADYQLVWDALVDISEIDMSTEIMGVKTRLPFLISPTAASRLFHPRYGERAVARAAKAAGMVYSVSTLGSVSIEEIAEICPGPKLFQVYVWKDRALVDSIIRRVQKARFTGLVLTVDAPIAGNRERDPRNDFTIPPRITHRTALQALARPGYLFDLLTTPKIRPANFQDPGRAFSITNYLNEQFDRSVTWDYVRWLKKTWGGPLAIKGIAHADDARRAVEAGADCVWISNHGGRQLETARPTIDILPEIVTAVGQKAEIILDSGVRRGTDIVKALALGANAVAIGRAYLFGLAAAGEPGVARSIDILETELHRNMSLMGCRQLSDLEPRHVVRPR